MPIRQEIVTLDEDENQALDRALSKEPVEKVIQAIRTELNQGMEEVRKLRKTRSITVEQAGQAREALQDRADRLETLPQELVSAEEISTATTPLREAIDLCDQVLREFSPSTTPRPEDAALRAEETPVSHVV